MVPAFAWFSSPTLTLSTMTCPNPFLKVGITFGQRCGSESDIGKVSDPNQDPEPDHIQQSFSSNYFYKILQLFSVMVPGAKLLNSVLTLSRQLIFGTNRKRCSSKIKSIAPYLLQNNSGGVRYVFAIIPIVLFGKQFQTGQNLLRHRAETKSGFSMDLLLQGPWMLSKIP